MNMYRLIEKKKNNVCLTKEELYYIVNGYTKGEIPDYQMSAFLMAVYFNGMSEEETCDFTMAMKESGDELDLSKIKGVVVDKHSTGGVGDKVSLVMGPMVAACGVPVAKMSGRGLGHTGGTIDKLESFTGFNASPTEEEFIKNVNNIGISWAGQTANLAPADKKIYALRDVTATVDSMPLIASSIMSKKLAAGAAGIVLDVTYGTGAFMKTPEEAEKLAKLMIKIGEMQGKSMSAVITNMEEPLGYAVGNVLEVIEAIDVLKGKGPQSVLEVSLVLGAHMLVLNGKCKEIQEAKKMLMKTIQDGSAISKMEQWIEAQGGNPVMIHDTGLFQKAEIEYNVIYEKKSDSESKVADESGVNNNGTITTGVSYVSEINGKLIGMAVKRLGGGRSTKDEKIDLSVGVRLIKKVGDVVGDKETIAVIYGNDEKAVMEAKDMIMEAYGFSDKKTEKMVSVFAEIC